MGWTKVGQGHGQEFWEAVHIGSLQSTPRACEFVCAQEAQPNSAADQGHYDMMYLSFIMTISS